MSNENSAAIEDVPALELRNIGKRYGLTVALADTSLSVRAGEAHALLGENGAGKSTLVKILSGAVSPDSGQILVSGEQRSLRSARAARTAGISTAYQELSVIPQLTVAQNLLLGSEPRSRLGLISSKLLNTRAAEMLDDWDLPGIDPDSLADEHPLGVRQQLELVRALGARQPVILLDEPTAALGAEQVRWLFEQIQRARAAGVTLLFISHRMGEVREICDRATVLRNGRDVAHFVTSSHSDDEVVELMAGHELDKTLLQDTPPRELSEVALEADRLRCAPGLKSASFTMRKGEILGVAALQGQGQFELFMTMFGARKLDEGTIRIDGAPVRLRSPHDAVRRGLGISLVPEDRKTEGVMTAMSGLANLTLPYLGRFSRAGFLHKRAEREQANGVLTRLNVREGAIDDDVSMLSGGNQQKIAIGKWLLGESQIMLLFDPTRGVDVGTKAEIFALMRELAVSGKSILFYSTDIEELLGVADTIMVLYRGEVVAMLPGSEATRVSVLRRMLGVSPQTTDDEIPLEIQ